MKFNESHTIRILIYLIIFFCSLLFIPSSKAIPSYSSNSTNSTAAGSPVLHSLNWTDNIGLSGYIFQFCNGTWNGTYCLGSPTNWLSGWSYRKSHIIQNSTGAGTNYQINITVINASGTDSGNIIYINNKARSDFGDVRFTNSTGSLLDYWIESVNSGINATFWIEIDGNLTSTNQTIYIYYGNSSATNVSDGNNTFPFFDDFPGTTLDTSKWTITEGLASTVTVANSICKIIPTSVSTITGMTNFGIGYRSRGRILAKSNTGWFTGFANYPTDSSHWVSIAGHSTGFWEYLSYNGAYTYDQDGSAWDQNYHIWEIMRVSSSSNQFYQDGILQKSDTTANTIPSGAFPMQSRCDKEVNLDWIFVAKYVSPEPSHGSWGSEETSTNLGWVNDTWIAMTGTGNWSNVTKVVNSTTGATIAWCVYANDTSNNWNGTSCSSPFTYITIDNIIPTFSLNSTNSTYAGTPISHNLYWQDNSALSGYIFQFCNGTWNGTTCLNNICYQEFANQSTSCGGLSTGNYSESSEWNDGDWDTSQGIASDFYVNYTKPVNVISSSSWQVKDNDGTANLTILQDCWNYDSTKLVFKLASAMAIYWQCFNGTDWVTLRQPVGGNSVWEEAMYWYTGWVNDTWVAMTGTGNWSNVTKTVNSTLGATMAWCVYANDTSNNWNSSCSSPFSYITTSSDATPPTYSNIWQNITNNTVIGPTIIGLGAQWNDNIGLSTYVNSSNISGSWANGTWISFTSGNWSNFTINTAGIAGGTTFQIKIYANDTSNNQNATAVWQYTKDPTPPTYSSNSTNSTDAGSPVLHSLNWTDNFGLSGYIFQFCNGTWNGTDCLGQSSNWLSGWSYRKNHIIANATGADINYTVNITVINATGTDSGSTVYINNKARSDFGDVRFTNSTGSLLNYWMESINTGVNATFWVQIDGNLTSTNQTIYIYYGNNIATNISNGNNTFLFFDHFEGTDLDANKWNVTYSAYEGLGSGTASYSVGNSFLNLTAPAASYRQINVYSKTNYTNCAFHSKLYPHPLAQYNMCYRWGLIINRTTSGYLGLNVPGSTWRVDDVNSEYFERHNGTLQQTSANITASSRTYFEGYKPSTKIIESYNDTTENTFTTYIPSENMSIVFGTGATYGSAAQVTYLDIDFVFLRKFIDAEPSQGTWGSEETQTSGGGWVNDTWVSFSGGTWSNVTKIVNSTGGATISWCVYANDTSNNWNGTSCQNPFTYTTFEDIVEIVLSQTLLNGIMFGTITGNTIGSPALNNSNSGETRYNITVGSSSTQNLDFYVKLNQSFETGISINESSSNTSASSDFTTNTTIDANWGILGNSTNNCTDISENNNCWMKFYIDVVNVPSGYKQRNLTICAVLTGLGSGIC
jgi:hypothetical protein